MKIEKEIVKETPIVETKAPVKKAPAKKAAVKKEAVKKEAVKETIYLQYMGLEINKDDVMKKVKEQWTKVLKNKVSDIKTVTLYLKPEENVAYYVVNGDFTGSVEL